MCTDWVRYGTDGCKVVSVVETWFWAEWTEDDDDCLEGLSGACCAGVEVLAAISTSSRSHGSLHAVCTSGSSQMDDDVCVAAATSSASTTVTTLQPFNLQHQAWHYNSASTAPVLFSNGPRLSEMPINKHIVYWWRGCTSPHTFISRDQPTLLLHC